MLKPPAGHALAQSLRGRYLASLARIASMDDRPSGPRRLPRRGLEDVARTTPGEFLRQVRAETGKVVWPTRRETLMTGLMVVIMTTLLGLFFFGVDSAFSATVQFLLGLVAS
jgi:preprotein translocase subunit SecE